MPAIVTKTAPRTAEPLVALVDVAAMRKSLEPYEKNAADAGRLVERVEAEIAKLHDDAGRAPHQAAKEVALSSAARASERLQGARAELQLHARALASQRAAIEQYETPARAAAADAQKAKLRAMAEAAETQLGNAHAALIGALGEVKKYEAMRDAMTSLIRGGPSHWQAVDQQWRGRWHHHLTWAFRSVVDPTQAGGVTKTTSDAWPDDEARLLRGHVADALTRLG